MKFFAFIFLIFHSICIAGTGGLYGTIRNDKNQKTIRNVNVMLLPDSIQTNSNEFGVYSFQSVESKEYSLIVSHADFEIKSISGVRVYSGSDEELSFDLQPTLEQGVVTEALESEVIVGEIPFKVMRPGNSDFSSKFRVRRKDFLETPGALQDISMYLKTLPGGSNSTDNTTDLAVRGGGNNENSYLVDGIPIFNINHFEDNKQTGGGIGSINPHFISSVDFISGGFSPRFPDKLSSVLNIKFKRGNTENHSGRVTFDAAGLGGIAEGPIPGTDGRGSYGLTIRKSALDFLHDAGVINFPGVPRYENLHLKTNYQLDGSEVSMNVIGGRDEYDEPEEYYWGYQLRDQLDTVQISDTSKYMQDAQFLFTSLKWSKAFNYSSIDVYGAWNYREVKSNWWLDRGEYSLTGETLDNFRLIEDEITGGKRLLWGADVSHELSDRIIVEYGFLNNYSMVNVDYKDNRIDYEFNQTLTKGFYDVAGYGEILYQGGSFDASVGGRMHYDEHLDEYNGGPRYGIQYYPSDAVTLRYAGGRYVQSPSLEIQNRPFYQATYAVSWHNIVGMDWNILGNLTATLEGYDKRSSDVFSIEEEFLRGFSNREFRMQGLDLFIKGDLSKTIHWQNSLSYAHNKERRAGKWYDYEYSIPWSWSTLGIWKVTPRWHMSMRFSFAEGMTYSRLSEVGAANPKEATRFTHRREPTHSFDFNTSYRWDFANSSISAFVEVKNIYGQENFYTIEEFDSREGWGFFPLAGVVYNF